MYIQFSLKAPRKTQLQYHLVFSLQDLCEISATNDKSVLFKATEFVAIYLNLVGNEHKQNLFPCYFVF